MTLYYKVHVAFRVNVRVFTFTYAAANTKTSVTDEGTRKCCVGTVLFPRPVWEIVCNVNTDTFCNIDSYRRIFE